MSIEKISKITKLLSQDEDDDEPLSPISTSDDSSSLTKVSAVLLQATSSVGTQLLNKVTLITYGFPTASLLALAQCLVPVILLMIGKHILGYRELYPKITLSRIWSTMPLPFFRAFSLGLFLVGAKAHAILAVPMSLFCEVYILDMPASRDVVLSLILFMLGIMIAAFNDLAFDLVDYTALIVSAIASTACLILSKRILNADNERSKLEIVWIESAVNAPMFALIVFCNTLTNENTILKDLVNFVYWRDTVFWLAFLGSTCSQFLYTFGVLLNVQVNGPLASVVVAATKNILYFYIGMLPILSEYVFSWLNFIGLNISMAGALLYCVAKINIQGSSRHNLPINETENTSRVVVKELELPSSHFEILEEGTTISQEEEEKRKVPHHLYTTAIRFFQKKNRAEEEEVRDEPPSSFDILEEDCSSISSQEEEIQSNHSWKSFRFFEKKLVETDDTPTSSSAAPPVGNTTRIQIAPTAAIINTNNRRD